MNALRRLFKKRDLNDDIAEEMQAHLEEKTRALMAEGIPETEARAGARRAFGNTTLTQENSREAWGWTAADELGKDLRYAVRVLRHTPAFTITAIAVLALGIGMNTAMFSAVKAVLLSALPYPAPERLVMLWQTARDGHQMSVSGPDARDWRAQNRSFLSLATIGSSSIVISGSFEPRPANLGIVSKDFYRTLQVHPIIGREFSSDEQKVGGRSAAVLISYEMAAALFGSAPNALSKTLHINGLSFTVIGILPPRFDYPDGSDLWISQEAFYENNERSAHNYRVVARLKEGVTLHQAQADMNVIAARLGRAYADDKDEGIRVMSLNEQLVGPYRPALLVLLAAVAFVLLIACVNISNLQLARAAVRMREMALRTALGAARARLIRQLLTESVLLSVAGGLAGLALAFAGCALLRHYAPQQIPRVQNIHIDTAVLLFTTAVSVAAGLAFGLLPALAASKADVNDALKERSGKGSAGLALKNWGKLLVVSEIAMAVVLLAGAALFLKSLWKLNSTDTGLHTDSVFAITITWTTADGETVNGAEVSRMTNQILERVHALPDVRAAGLTTSLPIANGCCDGNFEIAGVPLPADPHDNPDAFYRAATAGYFKAFGLPILAGRNFSESDARSPNQVALVNQTFVRTFFKNGDIIGRRIRFFGMELKPQFLTVIGIVPDVRALGVKRATVPEVFVDYLQHASSSLDATLVVQARASAQSAIKKIIGAVNPQTPVQFESMESVLSAGLSREHFQTVLLSLFAGFALLLAALGIYGVLSYTVTRRTSELGIRMALGARQSDVLHLVLREGVLLAATGLLVGVCAALASTRVLASLLYGVTPADPEAFAAIVLLFGFAALLGCFLPALRASRIDPNTALRYE